MKYLKILLVSGILMSSFAWSQVNINTATLEELSTLKGIGEKKARAIIRYRKLNGKFNTVNDLTMVKGIGKRMIKGLGSDIKIKGKTNTANVKHKSKTPLKKSKTKKTKK